MSGQKIKLELELTETEFIELYSFAMGLTMNEELIKTKQPLATLGVKLYTECSSKSNPQIEEITRKIRQYLLKGFLDKPNINLAMDILTNTAEESQEKLINNLTQEELAKFRPKE